MRSLERGVATNNKKNPGKRCKKGGLLVPAKRPFRAVLLPG
jgi:hypothetical protein